MRGFIYTLELLEPVLANSLAGDANSAQSLPFLPGALLRGALIALFQKQHGLETLDPKDDDTRRLFFTGQTRYLHAYPLVYNDHRALPAPLAWQKWKNIQAHERTGRREEIRQDLFDLSQKPELRGESLVGLGDERFCLPLGESAYWVERPEHLNVHTQRDAILGRADEERGAVFRYEALPTGFRLKGVIITDTAEDTATLKSLLDGRRITLGKSRTAGYGLTQVNVVNDIDDSWTEANNSKLGIVAVSESYSLDIESNELAEYHESLAIADEVQQLSTLEQFTLTMLSDTLVRDDKGQHTLDPISALKRKLGNQFEFEIVKKLSFRKAEIVGGFNRKWNLPLPQVAAIASGSTFVIKAEPAVETSLLEQLQREGLGERSIDGFGRVVVEWYSKPPRFWVKDKQDESATRLREEPIDLTNEEQALAGKMLKRLLRRDLDRLLQKTIHNTEVRGDIPNSQLSRLRGVVFSALNETSPVRRIGRVSEFLHSEEEKASAAWERMRRARVGNQRLTEWVKNILNKGSGDWNWLTDSPKSLEFSLGKVRDESGLESPMVRIEPDLETSIEYRLRLIDGVLARAAKQLPKGESRA